MDEDRFWEYTVWKEVLSYASLVYKVTEKMLWCLQKSVMLHHALLVRWHENGATVRLLTDGRLLA